MRAVASGVKTRAVTFLTERKGYKDSAWRSRRVRCFRLLLPSTGRLFCPATPRATGTPLAAAYLRLRLSFGDRLRRGFVRLCARLTGPERPQAWFPLPAGSAQPLPIRLDLPRRVPK